MQSPSIRSGRVGHAADRPVYESPGRGVMGVADFAVRLPRAGTCVAALEQDRKLVAGEHHIPVERGQIALAALCVMRDQLIGAGKSVPWRDMDGARAPSIRIGPR